MTKKISQEVRNEICFLKSQGKKVKDILSILNGKGIEISDKTIYRIIKEDSNQSCSFVSQEDNSFEFFKEEVIQEKKTPEEIKIQEDIKIEEVKNEEEKKEDIPMNDIRNDIHTFGELIKEASNHAVVEVLSKINKDVSESNDKLDEIMKETKKKINKPIKLKGNIKDVLDTDNLTEEERKIRRDLITKIRNYIDCFPEHEFIQSLDKQSLYTRDIKTLKVIYEEIQIGLNSSKDYEQFMNLFSSSIRCLEFVSNILLGIKLTGLRDEILDEIDEFDLKQLACELSLSRFITPQQRIILTAIRVLLKKILSNDLLSANQNLKIKLFSYYSKISGFLGKK